MSGKPQPARRFGLGSSTTKAVGRHLCSSRLAQLRVNHREQITGSLRVVFAGAWHDNPYYFSTLAFAAFTFAQRFFAPAIILAFASGLITLLAFFAAGAVAGAEAEDEPALPFNFAHRA